MNAPSLLTAAEQAGLQPQGRGAWGPCPVCGAERRSSGRGDRRGPISFYDGNTRWSCKAGGCGVGGDSVALLAAARFHEIPGRGDPRWRELLAELDDQPNRPRRPPATARFSPSRSDLGSRNAPEPKGTEAREATYPPQEEVEALWNASVRLTDLPPGDAAHRYLEDRALQPSLLGQLDLARVLPSRYPWPSWLPKTVPGIYRLMVPVFDATGDLRSLRFRAVAAVRGPKAFPPKGFALTGLVMADSLALALLRGQRVDDDGMPWDGRVVIAEGETDFWSLAGNPARHRRAIEDRRSWAVFGVVAGSWTGTIAARIPSGAQVVVWTDLDAAGDRYAEIIRASLAPRCAVRRRPSTPGSHP